MLIAMAQAAAHPQEPFPFTQYEPGIADVDMFSGRIKVTDLPKGNTTFLLSARRSTVNDSNVRPWVQLVTFPMPVFIPKKFASMDELMQFRQAFVDKLRKHGIVTEPYACKDENFKCPTTVVRGNVNIGAMDLAVMLHDMQIDEVCAAY